jgi:outer membrane lipoprotein SlyB
MKKFITPALAVLITLAAGGVFAADTTHTVKSVNEKTHTVTLDDGNTYIFKAMYDLKKVKVGEKVDITYDMKDGKYEATALKPAI